MIAVGIRVYYMGQIDNINLIHFETFDTDRNEHKIQSISVFVLLNNYLLHTFEKNADEILHSLQHFENITTVHLVMNAEMEKQELNKINAKYPKISFDIIETDPYGLPYADGIFDLIIKEKANICILVSCDSILSKEFWDELEATYIKCSKKPTNFFGVAQRCMIFSEDMHITNKINLLSNGDYSTDVFVFANLNHQNIKIDLPPFHVGAYLWDSYITNYFSKIMPVFKIGGNCGSYRLPHKEQHNMEISRISAENRELGEKWNLSLMPPKIIFSSTFCDDNG